MEPRIETMSEKKLAGLQMRMSFADNRTRELWQQFMPVRKEIGHTSGTELYSVEIYSPLFFDHFDPQRVFEKWAAIEVKDFDAVPEGMHTLPLPAGLYAVFLHKGPASKGPETYQYIFGTWLPASGFRGDDRPHFALMGEKYRHDDPDSEEELWIPVRPR